MSSDGPAAVIAPLLGIVGRGDGWLLLVEGTSSARREKPRLFRAPLVSVDANSCCFSSEISDSNVYTKGSSQPLIERALVLPARVDAPH